MPPYDSTILNSFSAANVGIMTTNPCSEINLNDVATICVGTNFTKLIGKRFNTKQPTYPPVKTLEEHPELFI